MHGVLPARRAVRTDVGLQLLALACRVTGEGLVRAAGEERGAQVEQFAAPVVEAAHERGVQALQDVRVGPQRQLAEPLQLPGELFGVRAVHVRRRLVEPPEQGRRRDEHAAPIGVAALRRQPERPRAHHAVIDGVIADKVVTSGFGRFGHDRMVPWTTARRLLNFGADAITPGSTPGSGPGIRLRTRGPDQDHTASSVARPVSSRRTSIIPSTAVRLMRP